MGIIERPKIAEPESRVKEFTEQKLVVSQPMFQIGFKDITPFNGGEELLCREISTDIILDILFGKSSDFYMELYSDGLIDSSFGAETELEKRYGFTMIGGESKDPKEVYRRVKEHIKKAQDTGLSHDEIERAKKVAKASLIKVFNSIEAMGNSFIRLLFKGVNPLEYAAAIDSVPDVAVNERLKNHFDLSNCVLSTILPDDSQNEGEK